MFCSTCARRLQLLGRWSTPHQYNAGSLVSRRTFHGTSPTRQNEHSTKPRHPRTWFLDPEPSSLPSSPSSSSPSSSSSQHGSKRQPRPRFTTFDPSSTTPDLPSQPLTPLHPQAESSPFLRGLYDHLTTLEDLVPESIVFLHTPTSRKVLSSSASMGGGGEMIPNTGSTRWDWIVVAQVRGRGKGVIGRAERSLRGWLKESFPQSPASRSRSTPDSRLEAENDWTIVDVGEGTSVNLFTADGRERWDLENLWR